MDGSISVGGQQVQKGDALLDADAQLPPLCATRDTTLVASLADPTAPASRAGTVSGQQDGLSWHAQAVTDRVAGLRVERVGKHLRPVLEDAV